MEEEYLDRIDRKLGSLLALEVDRVLRESKGDGARPRPLDRLLADAGLSTAEVASLLHKTQRAVQMALKAPPAGRKAKSAARRSNAQPRAPAPVSRSPSPGLHHGRRARGGNPNGRSQEAGGRSRHGCNGRTSSPLGLTATAPTREPGRDDRRNGPSGVWRFPHCRPARYQSEHSERCPEPCQASA
jgi:hypothetical protein